MDAAVAAIRAWLRLDEAFASFNRALADSGVTGAQLAILRIIAEAEPIALAALRARLAMHPATLGQIVDRLARAGFVDRTTDPADRRRRLVTLSDAGRQVLRDAPLAGPVRLRSVPADPARLAALAHAFDDAVDLFGLTPYLETRR